MIQSTPCIAGRNISSTGYARVASGKRGVWLWAHRVAWERAHGRSIPKGGQIHHRCENKWCINPDHLELMLTMAQHKRRHRQLKRLRKGYA